MYVIHSEFKKRILDNAPRAFLIAAIAALVSSCATTSAQAPKEWAAYGYLTPGPTSEPDLIGVFDNLDDCRDAADAWTTRQVVGNPVLAECYPVDRN